MKKTLNESKYSTLRGWTGETKPRTLNELEYQWLRSQLILPEGRTLNELWIEYLEGEGFKPALGITAMQMDWFEAHGYSQPKYNERAWAFWNGGGVQRDPVTHLGVDVTHNGELVYYYGNIP